MGGKIGFDLGSFRKMMEISLTVFDAFADYKFISFCRLGRAGTPKYAHFNQSICRLTLCKIRWTQRNPTIN